MRKITRNITRKITRNLERKITRNLARKITRNTVRNIARNTARNIARNTARNIVRKIMRKKKKLLLLSFLLSAFSFLRKKSACFKRNNIIKLKNISTVNHKKNIYKNKKKYFILYSHGKEFFERVKKLNVLSDVLNIDAYPTSYIKRTIKINDLKNKYEFLKDGERKTDETYVVYGRVIVKRNNGMFLNIQDDTGNVQIYLDENILIHKKISEKDNAYTVRSVTSSMDVHYSNNLFGENSIHLSNEIGNGTVQKDDTNLCNQKDQYKNINGISARKIIDVGDFIAVKGFMRKSLRGEITLHTKEIYVLTKSLLPLPDKHKGMKDVEYKYRKRYLDFLTNKEQKEKIITRFKLIQEIRKILLKKKYIEVDTPILQLLPGGATAKAFETFLKSLNLVLYLRIAPELYLKKLIISGISEKIFELSKCFRNEGLSTIHNPEFTLLEIYKSYSNYKYMIKFAENLIKSLAKKFPSNPRYNIIQQKKKWKKISFIKIIKDYTSINFLNLSFDEAYNEARKLNITFDQTKDHLNWGLVVEEVFKKKVEPYLNNQPVHIFHLPSDTSPLSKTLNKNKKLSERFETYIGKMEIANGYSEEANALVQEKKFFSQYLLKYKINKENINSIEYLSNEKNVNQSNKVSLSPKHLTNDKDTINLSKQNLDNEHHEIDYDYVTALAHGLPPTGGLGIGVDRLCMLFTDSVSIKNVLSFPIIKPN
ncbi:lysine--tRNA ligase [Plasmodium brasilianum]|uniref:Lysyl-tRNA synthetase n=2 Tax=Plasmodium (Plasmodium) TaxID=418103 RepID=A0A1A8WES9_PLAMA|nr:lysine--tRNA ligase, putative [Plasmodium malariae]KAI4835832.1 lysine--tRNA ligase [Plasmodium brasilianum]SBS89694.1 lysine--tRNA ligase, putative [Plasmodium malariae]SCP02769.1 lysine--tRNA ligase, putative [Plasmodium malariae]